MGLALAALAPLGVVNALVDFGTAEQQGNYLPAFIGEQFYPGSHGVARGASAVRSRAPDHARIAQRRRVRAHGRKVAWCRLAEDCELFLVIADLARQAAGLPGGQGHARAHRGARAHDGSARGQARSAQARPRAGAQGHKLGGDEGIDAQRLIDLSRIAWGAVTVGTCDAVLEYVKEYVQGAQGLR